MNSALLAAAVDRPLTLQWRRDLQANCQQYQRRDVWVVKDPLRLKYFRFEAQELWLLQQLDGPVTLRELQQRYQRQFSPQQMSPREIHRLLGRAHQSGLLVADESGQGAVLLERRRDKQRQRLWMLPAELLSLRLRGFDPDRLLTILNRYLGWLFCWPMAALCLLAAVAALASVALHWEAFRLRLPASQEFFGASNWIYLAATLAGVKVLHELGHGLACKRFGGECHEMGVLLLCLTPCLYCDVTDSWMIRSKWSRAAVGAAGMYAELWLAAIATLVWWRTEAGMVHHLALNVMFIGSVSTLVFNANPLMRYDGYYILADLIEMPNLRQKADSALRQWFARWLWDTQERLDPLVTPHWQPILVAFAVGSAVYRWLIVASILWFLYTLTEPLGFKIVGQLLALGAIGGLVTRPLYLLGRYVQNAWLWERTCANTSRAVTRLLLILSLILLLGCLPLPYYVRCPLRLAPANAAAVYVDVAGQVEDVLVKPGDHVEVGQALVKLCNLDLDLAIAQLETQVHAQSALVTVLRQRSLVDESARGEVSQAEQSLARLKEELRQRREQFARLTIKAPRSGVILPAPRRPAQSADDMLPSWHGHLLEAFNRGASVVPSDLICLVGNPIHWESVLAVDIQDIDDVQPGLRVDLLPAQRPGRRIATRIAAISQCEMHNSPAAMSARSGGELQTTTAYDGRERPVTVTYEASAVFEDTSGLLANGGGGIARVHAGYQSLAARLWRDLRRTFHFDL